jgi:prepilin-type N-terminal cleavage/methylation domain-containing protein
MNVERLYHQFFLGFKSSSDRGFTFLEILVVITIIGTISAIAAPSWFTFLNIQRLNTGQNQIHRALEEAKSNAKRDKMTWQVSFRQQNNSAQWLLHPPANTIPTNNWNSLDPAIKIDEAETTFVQSNGIWRVQFNYKGNPNGQLGRVTVVSRQGGKAKRCVITSTLIGAIRTAKERPTQQNGRFCY